MVNAHDELVYNHLLKCRTESHLDFKPIKSFSWCTANSTDELCSIVFGTEDGDFFLVEGCTEFADIRRDVSLGVLDGVTSGEMGTRRSSMAVEVSMDVSWPRSESESN